MSSKRKRVAYLGPPGSFTHEAITMSRLSKYDLIEKDTLEDTFDSVFFKEADYGVLPVENSTRGIIPLTYHKLVDQGREPSVSIQSEIYHRVSLNLGAVAHVPLESIKFVHTKAEAWDQCEEWVRKNLPRGVEFIAESSTSHAAQIVADKKESDRAVVASATALQLYELETITPFIQDLRSNATRFFIIGSRPLPKRKSEVAYKVTMGMVLLDRVGAIADAFRFFGDNKVDVRSVKISPVRAPSLVAWKDWFFVDVLAPDGDLGNVIQAIEQLRAHRELVLTIRELGRYPSSYPEDLSMKKAELPRMPEDLGVLGGLSLGGIIAAGEGSNTEFKSTLRWNLREAKVDKEIEFAVLKTIVGFTNSKGGVLLIGVKDDGAIHGLEDDYKMLKKKSRDGFELHLVNILRSSSSAGSALVHLVNIRFDLKEEKDVCIVTTQPSRTPIWMKKEGKNEFYVRSGNQTRAFDSKETAEYVKLRWG